jgi:hypothetical protein
MPKLPLIRSIDAIAIPVGRAAVVADTFGNPLVLVDLTKGLYVTDDAGRVTGVADQPREGS